MKRSVKLDNRVKEYDTKDVFSVLNWDEADPYVGTRGYFAETLAELDWVLQFVDQGYWCKKLDHISNYRDDDLCFVREDGYCGRYFIPMDKVKVTEKVKAKKS